ncbi:MAG TPA: glycosyltransferase family 2 protein [Gemmataceae bacterium]|nr:glycosyltransferase family 2 protein [Gemmataceae bacterium]
MQATLPERAALEPKTSTLEVTVVMPCLNEARTVGTCVAKAVTALRCLGVDGEVIVADNGSTDGSQDIARSHGARVVHADRRGYGAALQAGIAAAKGKFIIMGDADDSYDFTALEPFIENLRAGDDLVMGNRFKGGIKPGAMPWHHKYIGNPILSGILNLFFHTPIRDAHCGLRGFRKDAYERLGLRTTGMEFASEMVVKASLQKQKISEVPTVLSPDGRDRPPHLRSFRDGWRHLRFLLLMCPMWLFFIPATVLLGSGLGIMAWLTPGAQFIGGVGLDLHTMLLGMLCVFLGYQTAWLGAYAKIHGWTSGLLPFDATARRLFDHLNLERGLIAGGALLLTGLGLCFWLTSAWWSADLGPLDVNVTMRYALWGFTTMMLGVQTIFGSFFLSMLGMTEQARQARQDAVKVSQAA